MSNNTRWTNEQYEQYLQSQRIIKMRRLGFNQFNEWKQEEIDLIKNAYRDPNGFDLSELSKKINRTEASIACKAGSLGISTKRGKYIRTDKYKENLSKAQTERMKDPELRKIASMPKWKDKPHPRGMLGKHHSQLSKDAMSKKQIGKIRPIKQTIAAMKTTLSKYGNLSPKVKRGSWKAAWRNIGGIKKFYRSRWEANYARYLEFQKQSKLIREWNHECETFWFNGIKRGCVSYLPDFRVINNDGSVEFHEVKGWMDSSSKTKIKRMKKYHPHIILKVFDSIWYKANQLKLSSIISDWE